MPEGDTQLAYLSRAKSEIQAARNVGDLKGIRDKAEAIRIYAKAAGESLEIQNHAAEVKLRAERKAGELLASMEKNQGAKNRSGGCTMQPPERAPKLADIGIEKTQSHRWQRVASVPSVDFETFIETTRAAHDELTTAGALRLAKVSRAAERKEVATAAPSKVDELNALTEDGHKFACIYADPPWQYGNQVTRAATDNHYPTMTIDQICAMPIEQLAADNAHLHLWTTNAFLQDAFRVIEAWGFEYKSVRLWTKPSMGIGNYWRVSHEFLLLGTRGSCPFLNRSMMSWLQAPRGKHSAKPGEFRRDIEKVSPGPRLELFGRALHPGWTVFGNQIESSLLFERDVAVAV